VLNQVPPLHDPLGLGSIHLAGVMMLVSVTVSCQKWPPASSAFAPSREKISPAGRVLQEAQKYLYEERV